MYDKNDKKPVGLAITRIYDKVYNKLLESRVTDSHGRYAFLVDNNVYTVTAEKLGYAPSKIDEINLVGGKKDTIVDLNIALDKGQLVPQQAIQPVEKPQGGEIKQQLSEVENEVSRESLEELLVTKEKLVAIEKTIDQKQTELDNLEKQAQSLEQKVEQEITEKKPLSDSKAVDGPVGDQTTQVAPPAVGQSIGQPVTTQISPAQPNQESKPTDSVSSEQKPEQKKDSDEHKPSIFG